MRAGFPLDRVAPLNRTMGGRATPMAIVARIPRRERSGTDVSPDTDGRLA